MSKAIPLRAALRIQGPQIVVGNILCQGLNLVNKAFAGKGRSPRVIQWQAINDR